MIGPTATRAEGRPAFSMWLAAWAGGALIGVANGVAREATYGRWVKAQTAHLLSTLVGIAALAGYFWMLHGRWPISTNGDAFRIGGAWLGMTVTFEFAFGRLVAQQSWEELLSDYNLRRGRTWPLVLGWIAVGPVATRGLHQRLD